MSERPCPHCGMLHEEGREICPSTGKSLDPKILLGLGRTRAGPLQSQSKVRGGARGAATTNPWADSSVTPVGLPAARRLIGTTIGGKYNIRAVLGEGGMGTVFEALNLAIGRQVAVKVLHANQLKKKDAVRRFHQEARAAGAIGHPNICEVFDLGTLEDGCPYLVMEKLAGTTLADRITEEGGLPVEEVVDILTQVLSGLVAAHEMGIVHRDIKPENVFLTERVGCAPVAKLLDFGVSKMVGKVVTRQRDASEMDLTRTGIVLGTPYYLSPEQARGERDLDARVDLYACGVMLYEALTGRRPFSALNYNALLIAILTETPTPVWERRPSLSRAFDPILEKALARDRDDRYQTAIEFQRDLQRLATDQPVALDHTPTGQTLVDPTGPRWVPHPSETRPRAERAEPKLNTTRRNADRGSEGPRSRVPANFTRPPSQPPTGFLPPPGIGPEHSIEQDEKTTKIDQEDLARMLAAARAAAPRRRSGIREDTKTNVMNSQLQDLLAKATEKPPRSKQ